MPYGSKGIRYLGSTGAHLQVLKLGICSEPCNNTSRHVTFVQHLARWYRLTYDEYAKEANLDDAIVIECWKHMNEETSSGFTTLEEEVKYI